MSTVTVVLAASASSLALGYATAAHFAHRTKQSLLERFQEEKAEAVESADLQIRELKEQLDEQKTVLNADNSDEKKPGKAKSKGRSKNKKKKRGGKTQTTEVIKQVQPDLEERYGAEITALKEAHEASLSDLKEDAKQVKTKHQEALEALEAKLSAAKQTADTQLEQATQEAENTIKMTAAAPYPNTVLEQAISEAKADLAAILQALVDHESQQSAVLTDASGIIVAAAGDTDITDTISASADALTKIPDHFTGTLPLEHFYGFRLSDQNNSITGQTFELAGDTLALVTVGAKPPMDTSIQVALDSLKAALA